MGVSLTIEAYVQTGDLRGAIVAARQLAGKLDVRVNLGVGLVSVLVESTTDVDAIVAAVQNTDNSGHFMTIGP